MHNFKKIIKTIVVVAVCVTLLAGLDMALYPCTFMRNDIHAVVSNQYDDIILGTSHGMTDIDPAVMEEITGRSGHNVCVGGEYGIDAYYIARLIAEKQKPARIIYEVDPGYFVSEKEEGNNMKFLAAEFVKGFIRMANDGWEQGWHERNGGNLSYRVKPEEVEEVKENFEAREWNPIGTAVPNLAGEYFLVTGSGKYFRNVTIKPEDSICMIELDEKGENYRIVWGLVNGGRPTSELPSHLMNLEVKKLQDERYRVVYHAHTTNVIALTFVLPLEDKVFTRELWEMATECPVVFPSGIGVVPWMVPGGREIAVATSELMKKYDLAIWAHHGMFAAGFDFDLTFGLMHTAEKSAEILVKTLSMQPTKRQTITPDEFRHLAKDFGVTLPEEFLYEK